jgi:ribosomal protein L40E
MDPAESALSTIPNARGELARRSPRPTPEMRITRSRHEPRLCHRCHAPMAGQADRCWKCGEAPAAPGAAGRRRSLRERATRVQQVQARRRHDAKRRDRAPTTRGGAATTPKEA